MTRHSAADSTLNLQSLLLPFGFDPDPKTLTKLVRHQDSRFDVQRLHREGHFEFYQSIQSRKRFHGCRRIISFLGQSGSLAAFVGVYDVRGIEGPREFALPRGFTYPDMDTKGCYRYTLKRDERFTPLQDRLIIDWGAGTRSWVQNYRQGDKPVVEVLPGGYVSEFPGFLDVVLMHDKLARIVGHPASHREWHRMLASVAGVYLILDTKTGDQYVGSAYGERGILARWTAYAKTVHGDTKELRALLNKRPNAANDLQFSILQTLPITLDRTEIFKYETLHKRKLGTRAHGLNRN
jgi:hypothetical protein